MPQGDLIGFGPTVLVVASSFLGGYYLWATWAAPRVGAVFRTRAWLSAAGVGVLVDPVGTWPEVVVLGIQFGLLVGLLHRGATSAAGGEPTGAGLPSVVVLPPQGPLVPGHPGLHGWSTVAPTGGTVWLAWSGLWTGLSAWAGPGRSPMIPRLGARVERSLSSLGSARDGLH